MTSSAPGASRSTSRRCSSTSRPSSKRASRRRWARPASLEIELTETALMNVSPEHSELLQRLRARGIAVAIDDFGTGYSSLLYLRRL
ncbi:MAG: EAL domain-containing protein, partial [Alphaproteobacteria bacterium]|nr:EAL domain-containing protein [Alphaproteobacteria bacterium]